MSTLREQIQDAIERWVYTDPEDGNTYGAKSATDEILTSLFYRETRVRETRWADTGDVHYTSYQDRYISEWKEVEE